MAKLVITTLSLLAMTTSAIAQEMPRSIAPQMPAGTVPSPAFNRMPAQNLGPAGLGWLKTQQPLPFSTVEEKRNITNALRFIDEATLKLDYLAVARLTHPKILHANGGEEKYATVIATILATTKAQGMVFVSHEIKEPHDPFVAGDLVVCFVPEMTTMTQKGKTIKITGYQLAVRPIFGGVWTFAGGGGLAQNPSMLSVLVPAIPKDFKLPPYEMKVVP